MSKYEVIEDGDYKVTIDYENLTTTFEMNYQLEDLTLDDIRNASSNYLRSCLKEDIAPELDDMINKELYVREQRRPIVGGSDLIINDWLLKKSS